MSHRFLLARKRIFIGSRVGNHPRKRDAWSNVPRQNQSSGFSKGDPFCHPGGLHFIFKNVNVTTIRRGGVIASTVDTFGDILTPAMFSFTTVDTNCLFAL